MKDKDKTQQQLIKELTRLRRRIAELEATGSKRNQFEESRRTERDKAQQYLDIAEVMLVVLDKKGTITLINRKGNQILGYKEGELLGKNWFTTCLPTHLRKNVRDVFKKLMAGEGKQTEFYENPVLTKSGPELIIAWHNTLLKDAQGNIIGTLSSGMDITERKQAEAALRESEQRYRELFEGATEGILFVDLKSKRFLYANPSMCNMLGYSEEELRNLSIKDIHPRESWKHVIFEFEAQARGEKSLAPAVPCMRKDGTIFYADITTSKISINNKECNVGFFTDITERKEAEEALQESEARFRTLFEGIPDSILVHDDEGTILHINEIGAQQLEWSVKDLMGRNLREIVTPDNAVSIADHIRETLKLGWCRFETTYVSRSGWQVIAEATERPIKLGNAKAILSVAHDITERKRTEEALRESEERFRKFADEATFEGIIIHDEGKILDVNKQFSTMHGYERTELMGIDSFKTIAPESRAMVLKHIQAGYEKPYEAVALKKDGSAFPIEIHSKTIPFHGKMVRAATVQDITERKRAEEALRTSEAQLSNAMEIAKLGYWEYDVAEDIFTFNDHFYEIFRTTAEKVGGYKMSSEQYAKQFIHPDDISLVGIEIRKAIETTDQNFSRQLDHRIIYADGEIGYISVRFFIVKDSHGRTVKTYGANQDITKRKQTEEALQHSYEQLRETLMTTVSALTSMVEMKDRYTAGHQPKVAQLACAIAEAMGLSEEQIEGIRIAGLVHDIGKINIPAEILSKPGQLTEIQYDMVKMHPQASYDILKGIKFPWAVAQIALQHHERMDGSGYPQGLAGEEILLEARILAVANVVEAMTSHRPYRPAHDITETLQEISQKKGVFYDPDVVDACLKLFNEKRFTFD
jgi:PAS domain S-box-containing protein